jgi:hypothetical protein
MKDKSFDSPATFVLHTAYICENKKSNQSMTIQKLCPKIFLCIYGKINTNTFKKIKEHSPPLLYRNTDNANVTFA